jgi:hypothetical protein
MIDTQNYTFSEVHSPKKNRVAVGRSWAMLALFFGFYCHVRTGPPEGLKDEQKASHGKYSLMPNP